MRLPSTGPLVVAFALGFSVVAFVLWCLTACLTKWWWGLGIVPFGVQPLTFWQSFGLVGLLGILQAPRIVRR